MSLALDNMGTARKIDDNGWIEVKNNPLSKVGVFPYSGKQIGADPSRIYNVLRPEEELSNSDTIASFQLLPWINEHVMLGGGRADLTPAEKKGIEGVIGEEVYYKDGTLYGNIKIFSESLAESIESGKKQLSAGYRCIYEMISGIWNGQPYDAIQRNIRGNHLALVNEGRMGKEVAVLDNNYTFDSIEITKEFTQMADENKKDDKEMEKTESKDEGGTEEKVAEKQGLAEIMKTLEVWAPIIHKMSEMMANKTGSVDEEAEMAESGLDDKEEEKKEKKEGMDNALVAKLEKTFLSNASKRDVLAKRASHDIGTFDCADMTLDETAKYVAEKIGLKCPKGSEQIALDAYYHNRKVDNTGYILNAADSKPKEGIFTDFLNNKGEK